MNEKLNKIYDAITENPTTDDLMNAIHLSRIAWNNPDEDNLRNVCNLNIIEHNEINTDEIIKLKKVLLYCKDGDLLINNLFFKLLDGKVRKSELQTAVILLDSIYGTHLQNPMYTADRLNIRTDEIIEKINNADPMAVDMISCINKTSADDKSNNYCFSFASKFCSFVDSFNYPIFDKYASNLLFCLDNKAGGNPPVDTITIKKYDDYREIYCDFKERYQIYASNKDIDIFLWLYGKIISKAQTEPDENKKTNYQFSFDSISYKPKPEQLKALIKN